MRSGSIRFGLRALAAAMAGIAVVAVTPAPAQASSTITCRYVIDATWQGGFAADLFITNNGPQINGWWSSLTFANSTQLLGAWSAIMTQPTPVSMSAVNTSFNATIPTGGMTSFGWTAFAATADVPTAITVNGQSC